MLKGKIPSLRGFSYFIGLRTTVYGHRSDAYTPLSLSVGCRLLTVDRCLLTITYPRTP